MTKLYDVSWRLDENKIKILVKRVYWSCKIILPVLLFSNNATAREKINLDWSNVPQIEAIKKVTKTNRVRKAQLIAITTCIIWDKAKN